MQEIHSIGGGGRFFGGGGTGDRRLRPHNQNHPNNQALKCPRCDSLNTKFCYYNNYNLSQPRHFCKNCRRYWTKGGVLRNVPVGGGCRKSRRSNKPKKSPSSSETTAAVATTTPPAVEQDHNKSNSHSSSESSSLTATAATEALSAPTLNTDSNNNNNVNGLETNALEHGATDCGIFSEISTFTSLITSSNDALTFGFGNGNCNGSVIPDASSFQWQNQKVMSVTGDQPSHRHEDAMKLPENLGSGSLLDHTVDFSVLHNKSGNGGFGSLDWNGDGGADQGLFDLPNTVDQTYWTHPSDQDTSTLFHLP